MKQIIVLRNDLRADNEDFFLDVPMGKLAATFAHLAAHSVYFQTKSIEVDKVDKWMKIPHKVCLGVKNEEELKNLIEKALIHDIFVLSQGFYKDQRSLNMIVKTDPNSSKYIKFEKWGVDGQSWQSYEFRQFEGLVGAVFGPDEDKILNPIFGQLPLFKF
jgi:peptidyl-tRNA hydrolase